MMSTSPFWSAVTGLRKVSSTGWSLSCWRDAGLPAVARRSAMHSVILERRLRGVNETKSQGLTVLALELIWQPELLVEFLKLLERTSTKLAEMRLESIVRCADARGSVQNAYTSLIGCGT